MGDHSPVYDFPSSRCSPCLRLSLTNLRFHSLYTDKDINSGRMGTRGSSCMRS
jgi:hypothetical protein